MYFADFDGTGDRSVLILDGRERLETSIAACHEWAKRYNWTRFKICRGETFTRCRDVTQWMEALDV